MASFQQRSVLRSRFGELLHHLLETLFKESTKLFSTPTSLFLYSKREDVTTGSPHPEKRLYFLFFLNYYFAVAALELIKWNWNNYAIPQHWLFISNVCPRSARVCVYLFKFVLRRFCFWVGGWIMQCQTKEQLLNPINHNGNKIYLILNTVPGSVRRTETVEL